MVTVARRVDDVGPAREHGDRETAAAQRTSVVDPASHSGYHRDAGNRQVTAQALRDLQSVFARLARPDDRHHRLRRRARR